MPSHSIPAFMALQLPFQGKAFLFWCAYQTERHAVVILCRKMEHVNKNKSTKCVCVCVCEIISMHSCVGVRAGNGQDVQNSKFPSWPVPWQETPAVLLVCPCHLLWRGGTCGWEEGDPLILRSFRLSPVVYQKMKKVYCFSSLKLHGAILPPKKHLSALLPLNVAQYGALWLQTYPFGGSPAWLSVLALRHDIMPGWRQAGRGYGYNQMSLHCVCQRSLSCFHM